MNYSMREFMRGYQGIRNPEPAKKVSNHTLDLSLIKGRHKMPVILDGAVFNERIKDIADVARLERVAFKGIWDAAYEKYTDGKSGYLRISNDWDGEDLPPLELTDSVHINLYVTGLTVALIAALNVCRDEGVSVTLYHYNRDTGLYFPQEVR